MKALKKRIAFLMSFVLLFGSLGFLQMNVESCEKLRTIPVTVEGSIFGGSVENPVKTEIKYAPDLLVYSNNKKYNNTIAGLSAILSADVYFRDKDLAKGSQNRVLVDGQDAKDYDHTTLLKTLGFTEVEYLETFKAGKYDFDPNDSATLMMAHANINSKYESFVFVIRGCFSQQEWLSAFDLGCASATYNKVTGQHPEWINKSQAKGLSVAAERTKYFMQEFMKKYGSSSRKDVVLVTGHSRGGSIANIIGSDLEKNKKIKSFTYTFNSPGVADKVTKKNKTIFNVIESKDLFQDHLPFKTEKLRRYGKDMVYSGKESELAKNFYAMTGREMPQALTSKEIKEYQKMFASRFKNRESLYKMKTICETFTDKEAAEERYEECIKLISADSGLGLTDYCNLGQVKQTKKGYEVTINYCDAAWLFCYAKTLAYGSSVHDAAVKLLAADQGGCKVADFLVEHAAKTNAGHLLVRTYLISKQIKK